MTAKAKERAARTPREVAVEMVGEMGGMGDTFTREQLINLLASVYAAGEAAERIRATGKVAE